MPELFSTTCTFGGAGGHLVVTEKSVVITVRKAFSTAETVIARGTITSVSANKPIIGLGAQLTIQHAGGTAVVKTIPMSKIDALTALLRP